MLVNIQKNHIIHNHVIFHQTDMTDFLVRQQRMNKSL